MKKLIFLLLALGSLQSFGQVSKNEVNDLIDSKLTNSVRPSDIKAVAKKLSEFANQGDSIAKTRDPFIVPGSSGSYLNGLKQWISFPDLSVYATTAYVLGGYSPLDHTHAWSVITGKPTTVATSGITDAVSLAGAQALSNKTGNISQWTNNAGYLTGITSGLVTGALGFTPYNATNPSGYLTGINSGQVTIALGYTPVNPASTPSLVPAGFDTQNVGTSANYYANSFIRKLNLNSTASIDGATNGKVNITGIIKGNGAEITGIPYVTGLTGQPVIPTSSDYLDRLANQTAAGEKTLSGHARFTGTYKGQLSIGDAGKGGWLNFVNGGSNTATAGIGFNDPTDTELKINNDEGGLIIAGPDGQSRFDGAGGLILGSTTGGVHKLDVYGTSNFRGDVFAGNFLGNATAVAYGTNSATLNIDVRQGSATQLVAGWHPSGNMYIQPRGVRPADSGDGLQITGTTVIKGELRNEIGLGGFRTSDFFGATTMSFHNLNGTPSASNFFLVNSPGPTGQTYLSGNEGVSLLLGTLPRVSVTEGQTEITENLKINATPEHADNAAALAAGLAIGRVYRTGDILKIVH